jgi:serine/threonine protein kinase/Flp pilus assembly protein TadD
MTEANRCPSCGAELPEFSPQGLCPRCLLRDAVETEPPSSTGTSVLASLAGIVNLPRVLLRDDTATDQPPSTALTPSFPERPDLPDRSARLQLFDEIARGGMGAIFRGRDVDLGRGLAVKVLLEAHLEDPDLVRRFVEEAQIAGQLQHPGVAPVYELGAFANRRPYFTMKLVKGRTLAHLLRERTDPAEDQPGILTIFAQVCQTMAYAHDRGVIHRDLKPANIMVGSFGEVQVMDWGLAKVLPEAGEPATAPPVEKPDTVITTARRASGDGLTQTGSVIGTPAYMAPEQARGEIEGLDERCDVFALGSILCEILTGLPAFTGHSPNEIMHRAAGADLTDARGRLEHCGADRDLIRIAYNCLAGDVHARLHDARVLTEWLSSYMNSLQERIRQAEVGRAAEEARAQEARRTALADRRARRLTAALVLAFAALGGGVYLRSREQQQERLLQAGKLLEQATESQRALAFNLHELGDVLRKRGFPDASIETFLWAIRQDPDYAEAHDHLGLALVSKGDLGGAISEFRQAIRIKPNFAEAHDHLGIALVSKGDLGGAIGEFRQAIWIKPNFAAAHYNLGVALSEHGSLAASMDQYREAIHIEPYDADAHYNLGFALGELGRQDEAIAEFQQAVRIKPDSADAHFSLGTALQAQGKPAEAITEFREAKRLRPDTFESPDEPPSHARQRHVRPREYHP